MEIDRDTFGTREKMSRESMYIRSLFQLTIIQSLASLFVGRRFSSSKIHSVFLSSFLSLFRFSFPYTSPALGDNSIGPRSCFLGA